MNAIKSIFTALETWMKVLTSFGQAAANIAETAEIESGIILDQSQNKRAKLQQLQAEDLANSANPPAPAQPAEQANPPALPF